MAGEKMNFEKGDTVKFSNLLCSNNLKKRLDEESFKVLDYKRCELIGQIGVIDRRCILHTEEPDEWFVMHVPFSSHFLEVLVHITEIRHIPLVQIARTENALTKWLED